MENQLEHYYLKQPEPVRSCLLAMKELIMAYHPGITHERKYQIPFFCYKGMKLAFLWVHRRKALLGFVEDRKLQPLRPGFKRKDKVETLQLDYNGDFPMELIREKITALIGLYDEHAASSCHYP